MTKVLFKALVLLALVTIPTASAEWSWGSEQKEVAELPKSDEIKPAEQKHSDDVTGRSSYISTDNIPQGVLPIENHDPQHSSVSIDTVQAGLVDEEGRSGRVLGISSKLCNLGVKGMCKSNKGYPPANFNQYGNQYGNQYAQNTAYVPTKVPYPYPAAPQKSKPLSKFIKNIFKADKKHGTISNGYGPPPVYNPPQKGYGVPKPTYYAPPKSTYNAPKPTYGAPAATYNVPKPTYGALKPHYSAPAPHRPLKGTYGAPVKYQPSVYTPPKPQYKAPKPLHNHQVYTPPKPIDIIPHKAYPNKNVKTHVVQPSKVHHVHTHTHIYGTPHQVNNGNAKKVSHDGAYQASSHVSTSVSNGFGAKNDFNPLEVVTNNFDNQAKRHISQSATPPNTFNALKTQSNNFHSSSSSNQGTSFQGSNSFTGFNAGAANGFQAGTPDNFNSGNANGFQQGSIKSFIATPAVNSQKKSFSNTFNNFQSSFNNGYAADCQCVPAQYCSSHDLVARSNPSDISHLLDARNQATDILSNDTLPESYYEYDLEYDEVTTIEPEEIEEEKATEHSAEVTEVSTIISNTTEKPEGSRKRRDVLEKIEKTESKNEELQGRQLTGFTPGINGCGHSHVCCRRPVYTAAKRSPPVCGQGNPGIHGRVTSFEFEKGQSDFGEYPWQAAILRNEGAESMFVCGATLIDDKHLLTAAHCINDVNIQALKVRLGEWDVNRDTEFYKHVEISVASTIIHPEFYKGNLYNDIAVVRLSSPVDIYSSPHISPICLPSPHKDFTNARCHVTGWGKNAFGDNGKFQHILKELELPIVDRYSCENALQGTRLGRSYKLHDGFICAGGELGKDACKGDGGGPLMCKSSGNTYELAGVVSWGVGCGQEGVPGVYVNIPFYVEWIRSITRA